MSSKFDFVSYDSPVFDAQGNVIASSVVTVSAEDAVEIQKRNYPFRKYQSDEEALEEFMVVNYAYWSNLPAPG